MEQIIPKIFSEYGLTATLLILTLYWIYKAIMFLWNRAIDTWDRNLWLHRDLIQQKDKEFLKSVAAIAEQVKISDNNHSNEHKIIENKIDTHSNEIKQKLDTISSKIK